MLPQLNTGKPSSVFAAGSRTLSLSLSIQPTSQLVLTAYSDADWATSPIDRKSVIGYCIFFCSSLVSWSLKKQAVVSRSSIESEYRALSHAAYEITWLRFLSFYMIFKVNIHSTPTIWCDNISAAALAYNPVFHAQTKHIEIDGHFIRDQVLAKQLKIRHIASQD